jgi:hypothetical protein
MKIHANDIKTRMTKQDRMRMHNVQFSAIFKFLFIKKIMDALYIVILIYMLISTG